MCVSLIKLVISTRLSSSVCQSEISIPIHISARKDVFHVACPIWDKGEFVPFSERNWKRVPFYENSPFKVIFPEIIITSLVCVQCSNQLHIMSASPIARQACSHAQAIPSRKVLLTDPSQMPDVYSSTPGGTLYSTTPGGNYLIVKDRILSCFVESSLVHSSKELNCDVVSVGKIKRGDKGGCKGVRVLGWSRVYRRISWYLYWAGRFPFQSYMLVCFYTKNFLNKTMVIA